MKTATFVSRVAVYRISIIIREWGHENIPSVFHFFLTVSFITQVRIVGRLSYPIMVVVPGIRLEEGSCNISKLCFFSLLKMQEIWPCFFSVYISGPLLNRFLNVTTC